MIKLTLDLTSPFTVKPTNLGMVSNLITPDKQLTLTKDDLEEFIRLVGNNGHTFAPIFSGKRNLKNFISTNLVCIDIDNDKEIDNDISCVSFIKKCEELNLLPLCIYTTLGSNTDGKRDRFRAVFVSTVDLEAKDALQASVWLWEQFGRVSDVCIKNIVQPYLGGKGILYTNLVGFTDIAKKPFNINVFAVSDKISDLSIKCIEKEKSYTDIIGSVVSVKDSSFNRLTSCSIWNDLLLNNLTSYDERYQILTNLSKIEGGMKKLVTMFPEGKVDKAVRDFKYNKERYNKPRSCDKCPRYDSCKIKPHNLIELIRKEVIIPDYNSSMKLEEADILLNSFIKESETTKKLTLIKAPTGLGKTEQLVNNAKLGNIYCFKYHHTKQEFIERVLAKYPDMLMAETLPIPFSAMPNGDEIKKLYVNKRFEKAGANVYQNKDIPEVSEYLKAKKHINNLAENEILVTTHAQLPKILTLYPDRKVYIDEDPEAIVWNIGEIPIMDVFHADFVGKKSGIVYKTPVFKTLSETERIKDFQSSDYYELSDNKIIIKYIKQIKASMNNCIILSATVDTNRYKLAYDAIIKEIPHVKLIGKVIQYNNANYSKKYCRQNEAEIKEIEELHKDKIILNHYNKEKSKSEGYFHIRNIDGVDKMKGMDICIIGTPFPAPTRIRLVAACISGIVEDNAMSNYTIVRNDGRAFDLFTYRNQILRDLHVGDIESVLIQCVGRARLLRYNATVVVYSNFILPEAQLI